MRTLMKTDLRRFLTHPLFRGILLIYAAGQIYLILQLEIYDHNQFSLNPLLCIAFIMIQSALLSLLITTQHKDGILRSKMIAGYSKTQIFMSGLLTASAVSLILYAAAVLASLLLAYDPLRELPRKYVVTAAVIILLMHLCTAAINVTLSLLMRGRLLSLIIGIGAVGLLSAVGMIATTLVDIPVRCVYEITETDQPLSESDPNFSYRRQGDDEIREILIPKGIGAYWNADDILVNGDGIPIRLNGNEIRTDLAEAGEGIHRVREIEGSPKGALRFVLKMIKLTNPYTPLPEAALQTEFRSVLDRSILYKESLAETRAERHRHLVPHLIAVPVLTLLYSFAGLWLFRRKELF